MTEFEDYMAKWDGDELTRLLEKMNAEIPTVDFEAPNLEELTRGLAAALSEVHRRHASKKYYLEWWDGACEIDLDDTVRLRIERARGGVRLVFERIEK